MNTKGTMPKTEYVIEPGKQEIISTTILDAPRELVFKAYTDPKLFAQWWGPRRYEIKIDKFDSRPGGSWRGGHGRADRGRRRVPGGEHARVAAAGGPSTLRGRRGAGNRRPIRRRPVRPSSLRRGQRRNAN